MPLVSMRQLLDEAAKGGYGVGAFNVNADIEDFAAAVLNGVSASGAAAPPAGPHAKWIAALVKDLQQHRGSSVAIAGDQQSPNVHALAHAINAALGNVGKTVIHTDPLDSHAADDIASLKELVQDMDAGKVETLVIVGGNPVYNAPVDFHFAQSMSKVKLRIHMGLYADETSELCQWHIPEAHFLETWSDARAYDGTVSVMQPLILPLYFGRSVHELLSAFGDTPNQTPYDIVKGYWNRQHPGADFEDWWRKIVHDGLVPNTALPARQMPLKVRTRSLGCLCFRSSGAYPMNAAWYIMLACLQSETVRLLLSTFGDTTQKLLCASFPIMGAPT